MEKILTGMVGIADSWTLDSYLTRSGYEGMRLALKMDKGAIVEEVKKSNLRGRGGAGFPTGIKWGFLPTQSEVPKYLVINADEGEPGTFKDQMIMDLNPHQMLEGCLIASWALDLRATYIYIRGEFVHEIKRVQGAIDEMYASGWLGTNIKGSGFGHDIYVHRGAGAYICGEETALIESLEGKAGQPRLKPPFPAVVGVFSCPTVVNNVETVACVPTIVIKGGDWWAEQGCDRNGGPKMMGISGHVRRPGMYEAPHGLALRDLIFGDEFGGGMRVGAGGEPTNVKAVIPGGASCPVLTADELDLGMDFDSMSKGGTMLGTACVTVMDHTTCMVRAAANLAHFFHHESCGQCTPCREGTGWVARVLDDIESGNGRQEDLDLLLDICDNVEGNTICPFGDALAMSVRSYLQKFPEDFQRHIDEGECPFPRW
jgi:NADH-quinone oxidoreductase subunit F